MSLNRRGAIILAPRIMFFGALFFLLLFSVGGWYMGKRMAGVTVEAELTPILKYALLGLGFFEAGLALALRKLYLRDGKQEVNLAERYLVAHAAPIIICASIGVYGMMIGALYGEMAYVIGLNLLAALSMAPHFPRADALDELIARKTK